MQSFKLLPFFSFCLICCVTGCDAFFGKINFPNIFKTIGIPKFPSPFFFTTPRTSTTTPATTTRHPDDVTIDLCNEDMLTCPWTSDELVAKIVERANVNTSIEYNGQGTSAGPKINPSKIGDRLKVTIGGGMVGIMGTGGSTSGIPTTLTGVPIICLSFGRKILDPLKFVIDCLAYIKDTTIPEYADRYNAMLGCFKCRYLCELGGELSYL